MNSPIEKILEEKDWTVSDLSNAAGISYTAAYNTAAGHSVNPNPDVLDALEQLGYNRENLKASYEQFKQEQQKELLQS